MRLLRGPGAGLGYSVAFWLLGPPELASARRFASVQTARRQSVAASRPGLTLSDDVPRIFDSDQHHPAGIRLTPRAVGTLS